jgi:uncharacterized protein (DUF362 family)
MNRRQFCNLAALSPLIKPPSGLPTYTIATRFKPAQSPGSPGRWRGKVIKVYSDVCIDTSSNRVNAVVVREMLSAGIQKLTGTSDDRAAWAQFISKEDVVGIKVNCSGAPKIHSSPELVGAIITNLIALGVPASNIYIYERFEDQMRVVNFPRFVPSGVKIVAAEAINGSGGTILGYDPETYVEVNFFGEDDTRSNLTRIVSERLTKIINVPNMKEHQAAGVTGCLKNIAYGNFSNVARSHQNEKTNTYSFIGTLASVEPVPSRTVLHVMDGLRGVWHGGPFLRDPKFLFFPKQIMLGTDPVAMDRLLIDIIEEKRKSEGAPSIFDRSTDQLKSRGRLDTHFNAFIREPGHVEYASHLGLGEYDIRRIQQEVVKL